MDLIKSSEIKAGECVAQVDAKRTAEVFGGPFAAGVRHMRERTIVLYPSRDRFRSRLRPQGLSEMEQYAYGDNRLCAW